MADHVIASPWIRTTLLKPKLSTDAGNKLLKRVKAGDKTALEALMISKFQKALHAAGATSIWVMTWTISPGRFYGPVVRL